MDVGPAAAHEPDGVFEDMDVGPAADRPFPLPDRDVVLKDVVLATPALLLVRSLEPDLGGEIT